MKSKGFSLIELMITLGVIALLMTIGFTSYSQSRVKIEAELDRQLILETSLLLEQFYSDNSFYPADLGQVLVPRHLKFLTPKEYYQLYYKQYSKNRYLLTAELNTGKRFHEKVKCTSVSIDETGNVTGHDKYGAKITGQCWN